MASERICSVDKCGKPHLARGLCQMHYRRRERHGDTGKRSRPSNGEAQRYYAEIVTQYEGDDCLSWPFSVSTAGYARLYCGDGRTNVASRRLCEDVNGKAPSPLHDAAHSCGRGHLGCVNKRHLSWKTKKQNHADRLLHGTDNRGEKHNLAKLTASAVTSIRSDDRPHSVIARDHDVTVSAIQAVKSGRNWAWLAA